MKNTAVYRVGEIVYVLLRDDDTVAKLIGVIILPAYAVFLPVLIFIDVLMLIGGVEK